MRQAGTLDKPEDARRLADYLLVQGIRCKVDAANGSYLFWIIDEEQVARARELFDEFRANPGDPKYQVDASAVAAIERDAAQKQRAYEKNLIDARQRLAQAPVMRRPISLLLAGISILVYLLANPSNDEQFYVWAKRLFISLHGPSWTWPFGLDEVVQGQVWRLVTPIFVHMDVMHIVFNLMWLVSAGTLFETVFGSATFFAFCLLAAVASNLTQFFWAGPSFGGMSGVGFAIFGFLWAYPRFSPTVPFRMPQQSVFMFFLWYVLCIVGVVGHVANAAHTGGLIFGLVAAWALVMVERARS
jgi:GlpG protein